jgi:lipopolysaccharide transport system ATP-binding protein
MSETAILLDNVSKHYPLYHHISGGLKQFLFNLPASLRAVRNSRFEALVNISFEVKCGETFGIIGKNGSGKSTTLGLIAGVLSPSQGRIVTRGRISPLLELGGGFHPELTGRENIILSGVLLGLRRAQVLDKMEQIVAFADIGDFIDQPIRVYSSGMLARLGFSMVATLDPEILLIDEILAVGDLNFQQKCMDRMMSFKKNGVTMVFVSHRMEDVLRMCDRVAWIEDHRIRQLGSADEVVGQYLQTHQ